MKRIWLGAALLGVVVGSLIVLTLHGRKRPRFELSFWYWHSPFQLTNTQREDLKRLGVTKLFVRAGTFSSDGHNLVLVIPQRYGAGGSGFQIHEVFNFDAGVVRHFGAYDLARIANQIAPRISAQVRRAKEAGLDVRGVQFDLDCPTRLLSRYADLVRIVRPQIPQGLAVSATALMSWLGTPGVLDLSREVDFLAPQAYEGETGRTIETMRPVSDEQAFRVRISRADGLACPYYVGIPAYGHAFLFDPKGRILDIYRGLEPRDALRHPSLSFINAYPSDRIGHPAKSLSEAAGEEILKLRAVEPALNGRGLDDYLGYSIPTPMVLTMMLRAARDTQSANCLGAIIYRMPEENSQMTLSWASLMEAVSGRISPPKLKIGLESQADTFDLIESKTPQADAPRDLNLEIENTGGQTFLSPDAVEIEVRLEQPGVEDVDRRDMDSGGLELVDGHSASPNEASVVRFTRSFLASKQKVSIGPIRLLSPKGQHISIRWRVRDADGFKRITGEAAVNQ